VISLLVVLEHPRPAELSNLIEMSEQPSVEHFLAIRSVEALDVGVLIRLAGLDVVDQDAVGLAPAHEDVTEELRAVVRAKRFLIDCFYLFLLVPVDGFERPWYCLHAGRMAP